MVSISDSEMEQVSGGAVGGERRSPPGLPNPTPTLIVLPVLPQPAPIPYAPVPWGA